jgi:hypothetical protein
VSEYVTQSDRKAAARLFGTTDWDTEQYLSGKMDKTSIVQAFALHRRDIGVAVENAVIPILRKHKVTRRCYAEVAEAINAILVGKEQ